MKATAIWRTCRCFGRYRLDRRAERVRSPGLDFAEDDDTVFAAIRSISPSRVRQFRANTV